MPPQMKSVYAERSEKTTDFLVLKNSPMKKLKAVAQGFFIPRPQNTTYDDLCLVRVHRLWKRHTISQSGGSPLELLVLDIAGGTGEFQHLNFTLSGASEGHGLF